MKLAISILAVACLSACATPTAPPPSQPAPTAITEPAEEERIDEQLAKQLYWYRIETEPTAWEKLDNFFTNQTQEDWDKFAIGVKHSPTKHLLQLFIDYADQNIWKD